MDQVARFWSSFRNARDLAIVGLMLLQGLRSKEVIALDCEDLQLSESRICVHGKGNKTGLLPISPECGDEPANGNQQSGEPDKGDPPQLAAARNRERCATDCYVVSGEAVDVMGTVACAAIRGIDYRVLGILSNAARQRLGVIRSQPGQPLHRRDDP